MKITILTLFPEMFTGYITNSIMKRAIEQGKIEVECINFRDYTTNKHQKVDDTPYGGGAGMLLTAQPIFDCLKAVRTDDCYTILLSPQGQVFSQKKAHMLSKKKHLILICGHYEGFDERIRTQVDEEISIGDFVLTGGELGAMVLSDAIVRLLDGVIEEASHQGDSFENGLLEYPQYTKPAVFEGMEVPSVLTSGHHENIRKWQLYQSLKKTYEVRPDLFGDRNFTKEEDQMLQEIIEEKKNR